jgi:hypothetical protein
VRYKPRPRKAPSSSEASETRVRAGANVLPDELMDGYHARVWEQFPLCQRLIASNAGVNQHMNAVNDRLGYQVVENLVDMQLKA